MFTGTIVALSTAALTSLPATALAAPSVHVLDIESVHASGTNSDVLAMPGKVRCTSGRREMANRAAQGASEGGKQIPVWCDDTEQWWSDRITSE
ncbi:hypothetical protein [Actinomadura rupiterrae]|uniref:hypothetical protein n=1 Tax=Actinomadura rupiterrae TaxID=559627 RepID=UPI0020A5C9AE|nr:hypothetical protein [Actinomadura rupiterrae]MCP2335179.1 hypothetical protein [Actinomadura rupiterrae]